MKDCCFIFDSAADKNVKNYPDTHIIPLTVIENTKPYRDGIEINVDTIEKKQNQGVNFTTSSSNLNDVAQLYQKLSREYKTVYVFPMPAKLSGQVNVLTLAADGFDNVKVFPQYMLTIMCEWFLQDLISLKKNSKLNDNSINNLINHYRDHCGAALIVPDLTHLVNGGRINKTKGLIAKLLHIIPFNSFDREGVTNRANTKKISEFPKLCDEYFRKIITNFDYKNIERSGILMSKNYSDKFKINDIDKVILDNVASKIPKGIKIQRSILSSVIVAHTGPNYYAFILLTKK